MPTQIHVSPLAAAYAEALLELAKESNSAAAVGAELAALRQILLNVPDFAVVLANPAIGREERDKLLRGVFDGKASRLMVDFLRLANLKDRLGMLDDISEAYQEALDRHHGRIEVDVTTPMPLPPDQLDAIRRKVSQALAQTIVTHEQVDPTLIGGLILRIDDQLFDGSVRTQLAELRRMLFNSRPN